MGIDAGRNPDGAEERPEDTGAGGTDNDTRADHVSSQETARSTGSERGHELAEPRTRGEYADDMRAQGWPAPSSDDSGLESAPAGTPDRRADEAHEGATPREPAEPRDRETYADDLRGPLAGPLTARMLHPPTARWRPHRINHQAVIPTAQSGIWLSRLAGTNMPTEYAGTTPAPPALRRPGLPRPATGTLLPGTRMYRWAPQPTERQMCLRRRKPCCPATVRHLRLGATGPILTGPATRKPRLARCATAWPLKMRKAAETTWSPPRAG